MLGDVEVKRYQEQGYLVVENVITGETLKQLQRVTEEFVEASRSITKSDARYDIGRGHSPKTPRVRRIKDPHVQHALYGALAKDARIVDRIKPLLGGTVRFHHSKLNFKPADAAAAVEWHQDWAFYPHTNDDVLAIGVLLEDCDDDDGPLMVVPGSHRGDLYDHHHNGVFVGAITPDPTLDVSGAVALTAPAGAITIHHVRTVHGSRENCGAASRPLLIYAYSAADAWPIAEAVDLAEYDSRLLRGSPSISVRQVPVPIRMPLPRHADSDSIFDDQDEIRGRSFDTR